MTSEVQPFSKCLLTGLTMYQVLETHRKINLVLDFAVSTLIKLKAVLSITGWNGYLCPSAQSSGQAGEELKFESERSERHQIWETCSDFPEPIASRPLRETDTVAASFGAACSVWV